jgi:hypothetical protein
MFLLQWSCTRTMEKEFQSNCDISQSVLFLLLPCIHIPRTSNFTNTNMKRRYPLVTSLTPTQSNSPSNQTFDQSFQAENRAPKAPPRTRRSSPTAVQTPSARRSSSRTRPRLKLPRHRLRRRLKPVLRQLRPSRLPLPTDRRPCPARPASSGSITMATGPVNRSRRLGTS